MPKFMWELTTGELHLETPSLKIKNPVKHGGDLNSWHPGFEIKISPKHGGGLNVTSLYTSALNCKFPSNVSK